MRKELNPSCTGLLDFLWPSAPKVKLFAQRSVGGGSDPGPAAGMADVQAGVEVGLEVAEDGRDLVRSGSFSHGSLPGSLPIVRFPLRLDQVVGQATPGVVAAIDSAVIVVQTLVALGFIYLPRSRRARRRCLAQW